MIGWTLVAALTATIPAIGVLLAWRGTFAPSLGDHTPAGLAVRWAKEQGVNLSPKDAMALYRRIGDTPPPTHAQRLRDRVVAVQAAVALAQRRTA